MASSSGSITRRNLLGVTLAGAATVRAGQAKAQRPNILYIHSHDTGRYTQPYGHAIPTPNLQKLAEEGILFRQAFCAAPTCSPSRAALLTGQSAHQSGMLGLAHLGFRLNDYKQHLLHTLRPAGYYSALAGVQHVALDPAVIGYDRIMPVESNHAADVAPQAVEFIRNAPKQPFYLEVGFNETHRKFADPGPKQDARYCLPPAPLPDTPEIRADMAAFKASAAIMDNAVGEVLQAIEKAGLAANTLVISTTDHGIAFPAMKCNLTDHGIGVMLTMRGPGVFRGGKVCDALVSQIDIFPTICEMLEIDKPAWLQGKSLLPLLRGEKKEINDAIFAEVNYHGSYEPRRAVRTKRWKYIRHMDGRDHPVPGNCDGSPSKDFWLENGWDKQPLDPEQLYDTLFDPYERRNLAQDPAQKAVLDEMRGRLDRWMKATNDPILNGPVKLPAGAFARDADGNLPTGSVKPARKKK
jgi:N-sulfoglucosamine sulfohydrolase